MKLLSAIPLSAAQTSLLLSEDPLLEVRIKSDTWTQADLRGISLAIGFPSADILHGADTLRFLQLTASGTENYRYAPARIQIAGAAGAYGEIVSEYMLAALLGFYHNLHIYRDNQRQCKWGDSHPITTIKGKSIVILGGGSIGCAFARLVRAMGATAIGIVRSRCLSPHAFDRLQVLSELENELAQADVVALCIPGIPENYKILNAAVLSSIRRSAILLNVGRGNLVDTEALYRFLQSGHLGGAILDVVDPEPLPKEHPLWRLDNVIITPHDAGNFRSMPTELSSSIADLACQNIQRFLQKQPLINAFSRGS